MLRKLSLDNLSLILVLIYLLCLDLFRISLPNWRSISCPSCWDLWSKSLSPIFSACVYDWNFLDFFPKPLCLRAIIEFFINLLLYSHSLLMTYNQVIMFSHHLLTVPVLLEPCHNISALRSAVFYSFCLFVEHAVVSVIVCLIICS
jgi:hypothetical protein